MIFEQEQELFLNTFCFQGQDSSHLGSEVSSCSESEDLSCESGSNYSSDSSSTHSSESENHEFPPVNLKSMRLERDVILTDSSQETTALSAPVVSLHNRRISNRSLKPLTSSSPPRLQSHNPDNFSMANNMSQCMPTDSPASPASHSSSSYISPPKIQKKPIFPRCHSAAFYKQFLSV